MKKRYPIKFFILGISTLMFCSIVSYLSHLNNSISQNDSKQTNLPNRESIAQENYIHQTSVTDTKVTSGYTCISISTSKKNTNVLNRKDLRKLPAGTIIDITKVVDEPLDTAFYYEKIKDNIKTRINGKSYGEDCTVPYIDLRYVRVLHYGFDNEIHIGELIVNKSIAADIVDIFKELYIAKYPIEQILLVDEFDADDDASMAANNTSSFNFRFIAGSTSLSKHALGLAIDINPLYNPYVQSTEEGTSVSPKEGIAYADRSLDCSYYITKKDLCYQAFIKRGFTWGGSWRNKDYQHFQKTIK